MANIKSQIKRNRTNKKAEVRNRATRSELKTRTRNAIVAAEAGSAESVAELNLAIKRLDMAASKGIIHKNQAANRKSGLMKRIKVLTTSK